MKLLIIIKRLYKSIELKNTAELTLKRVISNVLKLLIQNIKMCYCAETIDF
jgi:hypothetical protein